MRRFWNRARKWHALIHVGLSGPPVARAWDPPPSPPCPRPALRARGVALVLVDLAYLPHPAELGEGLDLVSEASGYGRLIGDRKLVAQRGCGERLTLGRRIGIDADERQRRTTRSVAVHRSPDGA